MRLLSMRLLSCVLLLTCAASLPAQTFNGRSAAEWVKDLGAEDASARAQAVRAVESMGERAVRATLRALEDERPVVRQHAALALGSLGATAATAKDKLIALRQDSVPDVAQAATVAAMRVQVDAAQLPALIAALQGKDWELQLAAADVIAQLARAGAPAAPALVEVLRRDDAALDRTDVDAVKGQMTRYRNVRQSAALALGAIGPVDGVACVDALAQAAQNREWAAREGAAKALASFPGDAKAEVFLCALLGDNEWPCRRAAAESLAKVVTPGHPRIAKIVKLMTLFLRDADGGVRRLACEFLGGCGAAASTAVPELASLLASPSGAYREYAVAALQRLGPVAAEAKDALIACHEATPEDRPWVRQQILEALAAVAPDVRKELPALEQFLAAREKAPPPDVRRQEAIVTALAGLRDADAERRMRALSEVKELRAVEAIPHLVEWLDGERDARERAAAISVLTALDAERIVPRLRELLGSRQRDVRTAAAHGLAMFDDKESLPRVAKVLAEGIAFANSDQLWYLGMTGVVELAPALERLVANEKANRQQRWGATQALGYLRAPSSAKVVAAMVDEVAADDTLKDGDRQQLLAVGLRVLAGLDAAAHRELFRKHAASVENDVRNAAVHGLACAGDAEARAEVQKLSPFEARRFELPDEMRQRLEGARLRMSQVDGCTLRDVLARLSKQLGMPIDVSADVDPKLLDARFGNYIGLLGYRPSALEVLFAIRFAMLLGGTFGPSDSLEPVFHADRIELVPGVNQLPRGKR